MNPSWSGRLLGFLSVAHFLATAALAGDQSVPSTPKLSSAAKSPAESLAMLRVPEGYEVELVAAEPLVASPVAIDWGTDGRLWVVEMADYPMGMDGKMKPGGREKIGVGPNY